MYNHDHTLNISILNDVLVAVRVALSTQKRLDNTKSAAQIKKILDGDVKYKNLTHALKDLSSAIANESSNETTQRLAAAVMMMAWAHNFQNGIAKYDNDGEESTSRYLKANSMLDRRTNASVANSVSMTADLGVSFGASVVLADAASFKVGLTVAGSKTDSVTRDLDGDALLTKLARASIAASVMGDVGELAGTSRLAQLGGSLGLKGTRGSLFDGTKTGAVVNYAIMHQREGGKRLSAQLSPTRRDLKERGNIVTRGVAGKLSSLVRKAYSMQDVFLSDSHTELNTHKLIKGSNPRSYLVGAQSILKGISEYAHLQQILDCAYDTRLRGDLPKSLSPIVLDGDWIDIEAEGSANVDVLRANLGEYGTVTGINASVTGDLIHRWLPYRLWSAPHTALDKVSGGSTQSKEMLLDQVREIDPSVVRYLDRRRGQDIRLLEHDLDVLEEHANTLLSARGIVNGKASPAVLKRHARTLFNQSLAAFEHTFSLGECEYKDIKPESERLEHILARCWNRISLGYAQAMLETKAQDEPNLEALGKRIKDPAIVMARTHLYHAASIQLKATPRRLRAQSAFTLTLPGVEAGADKIAQVKIPSLGNLSATVYQDTVSHHSNFLRNGEFRTIDVSATHLPGLGMMDKVAYAIVKCLMDRIYPGNDGQQLHTTERAALVASLSAALGSGSANPASGQIDASMDIARQFEIVLQRSEKSEPWRLSYFQSSIIENRSASAQAEGKWAMGVGGSAGLNSAIGRATQLVSPLILGSSPSTHILQLAIVKDTLLDEQGNLSAEKTTFDGLRNSDFAPMFFTNNAVLDVLDLMYKVKAGRDAKADVLGRLARLVHNTTQYSEYRSAGIQADELQIKIQTSRRITSSQNQEDRLRYFTTTNTGRALLEEYTYGISKFANMKDRASYLHSPTDKWGYKATILTASGKECDVQIPATVEDESAPTPIATPFIPARSTRQTQSPEERPARSRRAILATRNRNANHEFSRNDPLRQRYRKSKSSVR